MYKKFFSLIFFLIPIASSLHCVGQEAKELIPNGYEGGYSYVDLGLSVAWATYNVGATKSSEIGDLYAWGEILPKGTYSKDNYKWAKKKFINKYCISASEGLVDNKNQLDLQDDVARIEWGAPWRMPTWEEFHELVDGCTWEKTDDFCGSGVAGLIATSKKNGNIVFFPYAGFGYKRGRGRVEKIGYYWTSSLSAKSTFYANFFGILYKPFFDYGSRGNGLSVRPVCELSK